MMWIWRLRVKLAVAAYWRAKADYDVAREFFPDSLEAHASPRVIALLDRTSTAQRKVFALLGRKVAP